MGGFSKKIAGVVALLVLSGTLSAQQYNAPEANGEGQITDLNFGTNSVIVGGYSYKVSDSVQVEIDGSYGAFTMLEKDMLIEFTYHRFDDGERRIITITQVSGLEEY